MCNQTKCIYTTIISVFVIGILSLFSSDISIYAQNENETATRTIAENADPIVYHLSSADPWRASIAVSDATSLKNLGHNVTLMLSIEGVQVGVKDPHTLLELGNVINNVTKFINEGGKVVVCETCLEIAGFNKDDILDGAILDTPELTSKILTNATVIDY
jgi:predicted peroxiredoxin